ncbi:MAG TPA: hypothetical protein VEW28_06125, partial [Candidatus Kapabacteria bacterium]|nr:hypothetical protein [Candidatus Kapabacteria bacterium]
RVGSWIRPDPISDIHVGSIAMTSKTAGTLTVQLPNIPADLTAEDGITISSISLEAGPGVHLTSFDGQPTSGYVGTKQVSIANGKQVSIALGFDNYANLNTFANTLTYSYAPVTDPNQQTDASEQVLARVPGGTSGDVFAKDDSTPRPSNVRTYALYFANRNKAGIAVNSAVLRVSGGTRILATGPFEDSMSVSYSAMNGAIDGKPHLFAKGSPWFVDGPECKIAYGSVVRPIYLTVAGDTGKTVTVHYQTTDDQGNQLSDDSVTVSNPLSIVHNGGGSGAAMMAYLYPPYPNPASNMSTLQFHLDVANRVTLRVVGLLGGEVSRVLDNQFFEAGDHVFTFSSAGLSTGTYTVILETSLGSQSQNLRVLR